MKTNKHMRKQRVFNLLMRPVALVALVGGLSPAHAQEGATAAASIGSHRPGVVPLPTRATLPNRAPAREMITDDGGSGNARRSVAQLIFALESDRRRTITVEVYNEQGCPMQRTVLTALPGRNALAMNVDRLREGRYVALMHDGVNARIVRFRR